MIKFIHAWLFEKVTLIVILRLKPICFNVRAEGNPTNFFCDTESQLDSRYPLDVLAPRLEGRRSVCEHFLASEFRAPSARSVCKRSGLSTCVEFSRRFLNVLH